MFRRFISANMIHHKKYRRAIQASKEAQAIQASKEALIFKGILDGTITRETHPDIDIDLYKKKIKETQSEGRDPESIRKNYEALTKAHDQNHNGFYW